MNKSLLCFVAMLTALDPALAGVGINDTSTSDDPPTSDDAYGDLEIALNYRGGSGPFDGISFTNVVQGNQQFPSPTKNGITVALATNEIGTEIGYNQADVGVDGSNIDQPYQSISCTDKGVGVIVNISGLDDTKNYPVPIPGRRSPDCELGRLCRRNSGRLRRHQAR